MTDNELVKKCLQKNSKAFEELYHRFASKMLGVCMRYAKNRAEAEDFLQEGFVKIFENIHQYKNEGSLAGWIRKIIVNTSINHYKVNSKFYCTEDIENIVNEDNIRGNDSILSDLNAQDLLNYIQELPSGYKMVFNLFAIEGYSHKEISEMLEISESTSKSQLFMARKTLQKRIVDANNNINVPLEKKKNVILNTD